jgi:hypothetical protein
MMHRHGGLVPLLLALAVAQSPAQETEIDPKEALRQLLSTALSVTIKARVVQSADGTEEEAPIWNPEVTKLTIPGRSIKVRLDGDDVRIYLIVTPYVQDDGEVLLLAQGQVWLTEPTVKESMYSNTFYTIPVTFGEPVLFFPLGLSDEETQEKSFVNIELEIRIVPYEQKQ